MAECKTIRPKKRRLCAGDLDRKIQIKTRTLDAPTTTVDFEHTFEVVRTPWAALESTAGRNTFFVTNLGTQVTHVFYIRWYAGLTAEAMVGYRAENYKILEVENLDERNEWYAIYCNVRGNEDDEVNYA